MLTTKSFDRTFIGTNVVSLLMAIEAIGKNEKVVLLDDYNFSYGPNYFFGMTEIEKRFLQFWGEEKDIPCLLNIDQFTKPHSFQVNNDEFVLDLGFETPFENIISLLKKNILSEKVKSKLQEIDPLEFNLISLKLLHQVSTEAFKYQGFYNFNYQSLISCFDDFSMELLNEIMKSKSSLLKKVFRFTQPVFQKKYLRSISDFEFVHLYLCIISPYYQFDYLSLIDSLKKTLVERGGAFRTAEISHWQTFKHRLPSIQLNSFEGVIHPGRTQILGELPKDLPFFANTKMKNLICGQMKFQLNENYQSIENKSFYFFLEDFLGTSIGFYKINIEKDAGTIDLFCDDTKIQNVNFLTEKAKTFVTEFIKIKTLLDSVHIRFDQKIEFLNDKIVYSYNKNHRSKVSRLRKYNPIKILKYGENTDMPTEALRKVEYFGPLEGHDLGLFSLLQEVKNSI